MGSAISKSLSKGNYRLLLRANNHEKLEGLVNEIKTVNASADIEGISCPVDASWEADIIIAAVPYEAEKEVAEKIREVANQKIVISISNPLGKSHKDLASPDTSAAEELQKLLPKSKVVKAFNTTFAADFATTVIEGKTADAFIAGNNSDAVETVSEIVRTVGFNPVIAGDLSVSRKLERMQMRKILHNQLSY